jgi:hypothetical protein
MTKPELEAELAAVRRELGERRRVGDELSWLAYIISQAMGEPTDHDRKWSARVRAEWDAIERSEP